MNNFKCLLIFCLGLVCPTTLVQSVLLMRMVVILILFNMDLLVLIFKVSGNALFSQILLNSVQITEICFVLNAYLVHVREGGQWAVYDTSPQSFIITFSYSLA